MGPNKKFWLFAPFASLVLAFGGVSLANAANAAPTSVPVTPTLTKVSATVHAGSDRVVFKFKGGLPEERTYSYVTSITADPSGLPITLRGNAFLKVRFFHGQAHDAQGNVTVPNVLTFNLNNVIGVKQVGDFEGVLTLVVELKAKAKVVPSTVGSKVRLDFQNDNAAPATPVTAVPKFTG